MMSFFKKLFTSKKEEETKPEATNNFNEIHSNEYFKKRYTEEDINEDPKVLDGCLKMVEGFFIDNKLEKQVASPVNHPINLDQVVNDGLGFQFYCRAFKIEDSNIIFFLALAFSDYLINNYGFKLYKDKEPEFPLRSMTLKYDKNGAVLSLYPFEYSLKVLNFEATFENLDNRLKDQIGQMPDVKDVLKKFMDAAENLGKDDTE